MSCQFSSDFPIAPGVTYSQFNSSFAEKLVCPDEAMNRRALERYEKALGKELPSTLTSVSNLALVLRSQGKYEAAEAMNRRALEGREKALGKEHPSTLTSVSNLA